MIELNWRSSVLIDWPSDVSKILETMSILLLDIYGIFGVACWNGGSDGSQSNVNAMWYSYITCWQVGFETVWLQGAHWICFCCYIDAVSSILGFRGSLQETES